AAFSQWEAQMLQLGSPEALKAVEQARSEHPDLVTHSVDPALPAEQDPDEPLFEAHQSRKKQDKLDDQVPLVSEASGTEDIFAGLPITDVEDTEVEQPEEENDLADIFAERKEITQEPQIDESIGANSSADG